MHSLGGHSSAKVTRIEPERLSVTVREVIRKADERPFTVRMAWDHCPEFVAGSEFAELARKDIIESGHRLLILQTHESVAKALADQRSLHGLVVEGAEVRLFPRRLPRLITLGSNSAILQPPQVDEEFFLAHGTELVHFLRGVYGALWEQATDLSVLGPAVAIGNLDPIQAQVLAQLHSGAKDETAAREINISVRTYRRYVAGILQVLDVKSRFAAGVKVAQLGLVDNGTRPN